LELGEKTFELNKATWDNPPESISLSKKLENEIKKSIKDLMLGLRILELYSI